MILETAAAIVNPGVLEIELAAGRAAHEQAREAPRVIEGLHEEGLGCRQAVEEYVGQRVPVIDVHVDPRGLDVACDAGDPLLDGNLPLPAAQILAPQGHGHNLGTGDERGVKALDHYPVPAVTGTAIQTLVVSTEFASR